MANEQLFHIGIKALIQNLKKETLLLKVNPKALRNNKHGVYWDIPGGRIEKGHTVEQTLHKEIYEETGITEIQSYNFFTATIANIKIPVPTVGEVALALHIYKVSVEDYTPIRLSKEHIEYEWFPITEAAHKLEVKYTAEFTKELREEFN